MIIVLFLKGCFLINWSVAFDTMLQCECSMCQLIISPLNKQMERKIIELYKCHLHSFDTSKEMCACLLRRFSLDRCMLRSSLFIREQSRLSFSILITVSILKGQFSLHKHLEVIKLKGQGVDRTKDNMPPAGIHVYEQNFSPSKLNPQISRS